MFFLKMVFPKNSLQNRRIIMMIYIKCYRKEDGSWEGKVKINLKQLWYLKMNEKLNGK